MELASSPTGSALYDGSHRYRYRLTRVWDTERASVCWVMLNPSRADHSTDDPTIRRVIAFSRDWGYGSATVVNLFAYRTHSPAVLRQASQPVGPHNDRIVADAAETADMVLFAWGNHGRLANPTTRRPRSLEVEALLGDTATRCLGRTRSGQPRHPLYLKASTVPEPYFAQ